MTILLIVFAISIVPVFRAAAETTRRPDLIFAYPSKVFTDMDVRDATSALQLYADEVSRQLGYTSRVVIYDTIETAVREVRHGRFDVVALASPLDYIRLKDKTDIELAVCGIKGGKKSQKYLLLTHKNRGYAKLGDLKNKRLAMPKGDSVAPLYLNTLLLRQKYGEMKAFFSSIEDKAKPSQAALSVFFGQAEACIITDVSFKTMAEMNPQIVRDLKIMESSPELVTQASVYRKSLREEIKQSILGLGKSFKQSQRGKQVLLLFKIEDLGPLKESDLASSINLVREYEQLKKQR
jgi:ABC-type phosphate/phosphonate transport system substrate-binding protein